MRSPLIGNPLRDRLMLRPHEIVALLREGRAVPADPGHRPKVERSPARRRGARGPRRDRGARRRPRREGPRRRPVRRRARRACRSRGASRPCSASASQCWSATPSARAPSPSSFPARPCCTRRVSASRRLWPRASIASGASPPPPATTAPICSPRSTPSSSAPTSASRSSRARSTCRSSTRSASTPRSPRASSPPRRSCARSAARTSRRCTCCGAARRSSRSPSIPARAADGRTVASTRTLASTRLVARSCASGRVLMPDDDVQMRGGDRVLVFNTRQGVADVQRAFRRA